MFKGGEKLVIEYDENAKWSVVDGFGPKLQRGIQDAAKEGEFDALTKQLEEKIQEIMSTKELKQADTE